MSTLFNNKNITKFFQNISKEDELEVMFNNYRENNSLKSEDFFRMAKYLKNEALKNKSQLKSVICLDINYSHKTKDNKLVNYRLSISTLEKINKFMNLVHQRSNNIVFIMIALKAKDDKNVLLIKKEKDFTSILDFDDLDIRFRKSKEVSVSEKELEMLTNLSSESSDKIFFRFKNRITHTIKKKFCDIPIELTMIQSNQDINKLKISPSTYELEMEVCTPSKKLKDSEIKEVLEEVIKIKQILSQNKIIEIPLKQEDILNNYKKLVFGDEKRELRNLYSMQPISAEVQHIIDKIPNKYCATDKADGSKFCLFITKGKGILIDNNLNIKPTDFTFKNLDDTLLEGELIFLPDKQKFVMMIYECLFYQGESIKDKINFQDRLEYVYKFMDKDYYQITPYQDKFDFNKMRLHYEKELENFYSNLDKKLSKAKDGDIILNPKFFIFPSGALPSEVFMFSDLIWEGCTEKESVKCPYLLDGIILTPLEQKYTNIKAEQKLPIYKYKPPEKNSIDFYLIFPRNQDTGGFLEIFDNSDNGKIRGQNYRVANFYVGDRLGNKEVPVPFMKEYNNFEAFFPVEDGQVRDIAGDVIQDKTVIEVTYDNDQDVPHQYRWKILKTRWDKTESVNKHNQKYGNFRDVAIRTWVSIKESVSMNEIKNLANPDSYDKTLNNLKNRIDTTIISSNRAQDEYYQKIRNLVQIMRDYHNFIKSILIYTYCSPKYLNREKKETRLDILDLQSGEGNDIMKYYHPRVKNYVGIEIDYDKINSPGNGALARYKLFKGKFPDFPRMKFIQANSGILLDGDKQKSVLSNMKKENQDLIDSTFSSKNTFDVVSCQFSLPQFFENETILNNLCQNINNNLKKGGYMIFTLLDGNRVLKLLGEKEKYVSTYTDEEGKKETLFEISKNFTESKNFNQTGLSLGTVMKWVSETEQTEYLVTPEFLEETMKKKCDAILVDSDNFENLYTMNRNFFDDVIPTEDNPKNKAYYERIAKFYDNLKASDKESKTFSFLNRYYIFHKKL